MSDFTNELITSTERIYTPDLDMKQAYMFQSALPASGPVFSLQVPSVLPHRKIWSELFSLSAGVTRSWALSAYLNGRQVWQMNMCFSGGPTLDRWQFRAHPTGYVGGTAGQVFLNWAGTATFIDSVCPLFVNIACDTINLDPFQAVNGAGIVFDGFLFVQSQAGP